MDTGQISGIVRWLRFNLVGGLGVAVQLAILWLLIHFDLPYLIATILAVEATVVHNFVWHERYTWSDRPIHGVRSRLVRLLKLNLSNGLVSLVGNVWITDALVRREQLPILAANAVAIVVCSTINFLIGDRFVFPPPTGRGGESGLFCGT